MASSTGSKTATAKIRSARNQSGLRNLNERVILTLIRRRGAMAKAEISAATGLSAQAVTVIINQLEADGLLLRQEPQRGKVGQPSVPFALNPTGTYAYGLKIGRRSYDLTLIDFTGGVQGSLHENCPYPSVDSLIRFLKRGLQALAPEEPETGSSRICGIGIAMPSELWSWTEELGAPAAVMNQWRHFDLKAGLSPLTSLPIYICNDDTAACAAEFLFGNPGRYQDFLYFYIGSFVGGGVVINGELYPGHRGNAGAVGSMPVPAMGEKGEVVTCQLISQASIRVLEKLLTDSGHDPQEVLKSYDYWGDPGPALDRWIDQVGAALGYASVAGMSLIDFDAIVIDGHIPVPVRHRIVDRVRENLAKRDLRGLSPVDVVEGTIGTRAQSIGSAALPFLVEYESRRSIGIIKAL